MAPQLVKFGISMSLVEPGPVATPFMDNIDKNTAAEQESATKEPTDDYTWVLSPEILGVVPMWSRAMLKAVSAITWHTRETRQKVLTADCPEVTIMQQLPALRAMLELLRVACTWLFRHCT